MEEWRVIKEHPNYSVSNLGNVMNNKTNKIMKICLKGGYYNVSLVNETGQKTIKVHRLVAFAFIENPENKSDVNHEDKNKLNNNISNLTWMTRKENNQHKSIGLIYKSNKNKPVMRLSKNEEVLENYNSIEDAGQWAFENKLTDNSHNGRNAIGNCVNGLSSKAYGFKWKYIDNSLENEEWREIDYKKIFSENILTDKKYYVSNLGRFKNIYGQIMDNYKVNENGYIRVYIYKKTIALHRLVAYTFLENPENKEQVNHKDGNKLNNKVENLEWCSNAENQKHKFEMGLGNNFTRKVKQYDLNWNLIKEYNSISSAAKEMNISKGTIQSVLLKNRKTAAGYIWKYSDDVNIDFSEKISINENKGRSVGQYDLNVNLIKIHNSIADAGRNVGVHKNNIWGVINNFRKTSGGFIWKYLD
jgi:molybdenum-dependent DNA-binding transcriptional regulator ModE